MLEVSYKFAVIILMILLGYTLKRAGFLSRKDGDSLAKIAFSVTLPALIISSMNDIVLKKTHIIFPFIGISIGMIMLAVSFFVYRNNKKRDKGMLTMPLLGINIGLFGVPLVLTIWGEETVRYLLLIDLGNAFVIFVLCYIVGAIYANDKEDVNIKKITQKAFHSIPLIVYILTIILRILNVSYPKIVIDIADILKQANTTVSMVALGLFLSFSFKKKHITMVIKFLLTKYVIGFILGISVFLFLPIEEHIKVAILVASVLPASFSVLPYSVEFGYDRKFVGVLVNSSIVVSVIFMWMIAMLV